MTDNRAMAKDENESLIFSVLTEFAKTIRSQLEINEFFSARLELQVQHGKIRLSKIATEKTQILGDADKKSL